MCIELSCGEETLGTNVTLVQRRGFVEGVNVLQFGMVVDKGFLAVGAFVLLLSGVESVMPGN